MLRKYQHYNLSSTFLPVLKGCCGPDYTLYKKFLKETKKAIKGTDSMTLFQCATAPNVHQKSKYFFPH